MAAVFDYKLKKEQHEEHMFVPQGRATPAVLQRLVRVVLQSELAVRPAVTEISSISSSSSSSERAQMYLVIQRGVALVYASAATTQQQQE
jgi:hypothetical protein